MQEIVFADKIEAYFKVIVIGDPEVGKSKLLTDSATNRFEENYITSIGVSIFKKSIELEDENALISLVFWDIASQPYFYKLHRPYFNGANGIIMVFDISRLSTFSNINNWYSSAVKYGLSRVPKILIGNEVNPRDTRKISIPDAICLSKKLNALYFETSFRTRVRFEIICQKIAELIYNSKIN